MVRPLLITVTATVIAFPAAAQVPTRDVAAPTATFAEPFTRIMGLRELSDGRVVISDMTERHVSILDFDAGSMRQIGRTGGGPGEYESPGGLIALPDDATMLVDFGNMRVGLITSAGRLTDTWPMMSGEGGLRNPSGADTDGNLYYSSMGSISLGRGSNIEIPDSSPVYRWDLEHDTTEPIASLFADRATSGEPIRLSRSGGAMRISGVSLRPFRRQDGWAVAPDGSVAVVRATEYRVEWHRPTGMTRGPVIDYEPVRIDQAEKEAWAEARSNMSAMFSVASSSTSSGGGGMRMQMPRPDLDEVEFPETKPPFGDNAVHISPNGRLWVERLQRHDADRPLYDVFDERGQLIERIRLPAGRDVVGFGNNTIYAVMTDESDLQWLERYEI